jgi:hypothetical protein
MTYLPSGHLSLIANVLSVSLIGLFGIACILRPKFGNLSRAMGLIFFAVAVAYSALLFGSWRGVAISCAVFLAAGFFWCAVECFRLRKARALSRTVGASLVLLGASSEYCSWLIWSHIPTR